ncbi:MAG: hypothetical protein LLG06_12630 [Desulfobacteraceae bacterium]|nr:hypothetical protein [Desulfobacteraceae bacterium]
MEDKLYELIEEKGPLTGSEILDALGEKPLAVWKTCLSSPRLEARKLGRRYLRLDRKVEGFARLSPSILREFMTYTIVGLRGKTESLDRRADAVTRHILAVSSEKLALAKRIVDDLRNKFAEHWPAEGRICFIIAGDIVYDMAHDVPRPETSIGEMVNGSDIDLVVVTGDRVPKQFLKDLDQAIYKEKYYTMIAPSLREELDYVVKDMDRVREQLLFDNFKRMVACKILQEGKLLAGSQPLFEEIKALLLSRGVTERLREMEEKAAEFRRKSEECLLSSDPAQVSRDVLNLLYTTEESEEFE